MYMYKQDLALTNLQRLICHKIQTNKQTNKQTKVWAPSVNHLQTMVCKPSPVIITSPCRRGLE